MLDEQRRCRLGLQATALLDRESMMPDNLYSIGSAARAARMPRVNLTRWIERSYPVLNDEADLRSPGRGRAARFSFETILQIAIAAELSRRGVAPRDALLAALQFTSIGAKSMINRGAPVGQTFGIYRGEHEQDLEIFRVEDDDPMKLPALFGGEQSLVVLDLLEIYRHVVRELGRDQEGDA